jgi:hypothetical protein
MRFWSSVSAVWAASYASSKKQLCKLRSLISRSVHTLSKKGATGSWEEHGTLFQINDLSVAHDAFHVFSTLGRSSTRCYCSRGTT